MCPLHFLSLPSLLPFKRFIEFRVNLFSLLIVNYNSSCLILSKTITLHFAMFYEVVILKDESFISRRHWRHGFDPWVEKGPLEQEMATHSSMHVCRIPWTVKKNLYFSICLKNFFFRFLVVYLYHKCFSVLYIDIYVWFFSIYFSSNISISNYNIKCINDFNKI